MSRSPTIPLQRCFNPRPTRRSGATRPPSGRCCRRWCFNPRPTRRSGATGEIEVAFAADGLVSILAQPEGRALRSSTRIRALATTFQSSPNPKVGRYTAGPIRPASQHLFQSSPNPKVGRYRTTRQPIRSRFRRFNPRPTRRSGATRVVRAVAPRQPCFNPRPTRRSGATALMLSPSLAVDVVSILAQPEGRALRAGGCRARGRTGSFNPRPTRRSGATRPTRSCSPTRSCFNPRPTRRSGATWCDRSTSPSSSASFNPRPTRRSGATWGQPAPSMTPVQCFNPRPTRRSGATVDVWMWHTASFGVSILAQPEGRALRSQQRSAGDGQCSFNPRPTRRSGATGCSDADWPGQQCFNPRPTRRSGATGRLAALCVESPGFNPRPTRRSGATLPAHPSRGPTHVSILAQPEGRALLIAPGARQRQDGMFQSSPNPKVGRYTAQDNTEDQPQAVSILAQPEGRALLAGVVDPGEAVLFQSSPNPKVGRYDRQRPLSRGGG